MTKISLGQQHDDSASELSVHTDGASALEIKGGDLHDRARQSVDINDRVAEAAASSAPAEQGASGIRTGAFLLVALAVIVAILIGVTQFVSPVWIPIVLAAAMVLLYLMAMATLPRERLEHLSGFAAVLKEFFAFTRGGKPGAGS